MKIIGKTPSDLVKEEQNKALVEESARLQEYLNSTDWYVTRLIEREVAIPDEVKKQRAFNVSRINEIRAILSGEFI